MGAVSNKAKHWQRAAFLRKAAITRARTARDLAEALAR